MSRISAVFVLIPSDDVHDVHRPSSLSLSVSVTHREEDKNIFDYCRENNIDHINKAISSQKVDVNAKDEEVTEDRIIYILFKIINCRT